MVTSRGEGRLRLIRTEAGKAVAAFLCVACVWIPSLPIAFARPSKPPADLIPAGRAWWCYAAWATYNPRDRASVCVRSETECNKRQAASDDDPGDESTECRRQAKAAVVTYFDVMNDEWRMWATESTRDCKDTRRFLTRGDTTAISQCKLVGATFLKPLRFQANAVPGGSTWHCYVGADGKFGQCFRSEEQCLNEGACAEQAEAWVLMG